MLIYFQCQHLGLDLFNMAEEDRDRKRLKSRDEEEQKEDGEKASKSAKAIRLLREVTTLLTESVGDEEAKETREVPKPEGSLTPSSTAILSEFRSIFAPYKQVSPVPLTSTFQQPKNRPSKQKQRGVFFQPKETWTHDFFCLAQKGQERVPAKSEKFQLQAAGLGRRKICFHSKAKFAELREKLEEEFPKLKTGGGFVLMRSGHLGNSCLATIIPPASGYTVPFLRDLSGLGQATAYIRPLQRDLDSTPVSAEEPTGNVVTVTCLNCGTEVAVTQWDVHDSLCQGGPSGQQSTCTDCFDLTTENDNYVEITASKKSENPSIENSSTSSLTDKASTKDAHNCHGDLQSKDCSDAGSSENGMDILMDMFPNVDEEDLLLTLKENNFELEEAISDILIKNSPFGHADEDISTGTAVEFTLKDALEKYQKDVNGDRCKIIDVDRGLLWKTALMFYKSSSKEHLYRKLNVMFEGMEDAVDAGALSLEFFADLVRTINDKLFEGKAERRVPQYSWENVYLMKMAGLMVAHSLLQKGPGMPCLAPYVYEFVVSGEKEHAAAYVHFEDLPQTSQTEVLVEFLKRVEDAQTDEDICELCDEPKFSTVFDTSGWPIGRVLNMKSKADFVTYMLVEELVGKRLQLLQNFRDGLNYFGLVTMLTEKPSLWKPLFVTENQAPLSADTFISLVEPPSGVNELQERAYALFIEFVKRHAESSENIPVLGADVPVLNLLLKFITTNLHVPPTGLERKISVQFLPERESLPDAKSCFNTILLPVKHGSADEFHKAMMTSLRHASCSFAAGF